MSHCQGPGSSKVPSFLLATKQEEKVSFNLPDLNYEEDNDDGKSTDIEVDVCVYIVYVGDSVLLRFSDCLLVFTIVTMEEMIKHKSYHIFCMSRVQ